MVVILANDIFILILFLAPCTISRPVGAKVIIPISYKGLKDADQITWMHGNDRVYYRKDGVVTEEKLKITPDGSLVVDNIKSSDSGTYECMIFNVTGVHLHTSSEHLCILVKFCLSTCNTCPSLYGQ